MSLPLFTDEAIYTRWSQIAGQDAAWRFISLTDGKQPLFIWLDIVLMRFISDPLLAGRLVSVFAGFIVTIGIFLLAKELFRNKKIGLLASFIYVIFPFSLVYDRMALYDSLVSSVAVWALYFEVLLIRRRRLDIALILGMILGAGVLTKTSAFFFIYLLPFSALLFNLKEKYRIKKLIKWAALSVVSVILAYSFYSVLRLSPFFHIITDKNAVFIYPFNEWVNHPFRFVEGNLRGLFDWLITYMSIPLFIMVILSFVIRLKKFIFEKILLFIWFAVPFFALAVFGKVLYPRFILFMMMPLLVLISYSIYFLLGKIKRNQLKALAFFALIIICLRTDFYILKNFSRAPIPYSDLEQYVNSWPSGGGVKQLITFLGEKSENNKIYVASEGTFGSLPTFAIEIYLGNNKNIEKRGIWPLPSQIPEDLIIKTKSMPVYFIFNESQYPPPEWPLKFIDRYQKGIGDSYMSLYEVVGR